MRLELEEISAGGIVREYSVAAEAFPELKTLVESGQLNFLSPLDFSLRLQRAGTLVELDGKLVVAIKEECGRCLTRFSGRVDSEFSLTFTPLKEPEADQEEEVELETAELGLIPYEAEQIDLLLPLQEQVILSLPISPLCKEDCRGLCSECGANLNETDCGCEKKPFNSKFAALKNLQLDSE
jgi:uncharacterized protein